MIKIFIDGSEGTTGLQIRERLQSLKGFEVLALPDHLRKDPLRRGDMINRSDITILCLPDDAAKESVSLVNNPDVRVIDASTAHRTAEGWAYGFPELGETFLSAVQKGKRVAVPGCHASGFLALVYPLLQQGVLDKSALLSVTSLTGYSGGGKSMIARYQDPALAQSLQVPRPYALTQEHKHLKEMQGISGLKTKPVFCPVVCNFYCGMAVTVPLHADMLKGGANIESLRELYQNYYNGKGNVAFVPQTEDDIRPDALGGKDNMEIRVNGNGERITLTAVYDNLGKGASGAAVQCLRLMTAQ
jgi:N-acetyl-gamma-glutamyl-phosphate reductase